MGCMLVEGNIDNCSDVIANLKFLTAWVQQPACLSPRSFSSFRDSQGAGEHSLPLPPHSFIFFPFPSFLLPFSSSFSPMSRSVDSTPGPHHVRRLLDQRINRLDPDDNFCGLTQYTDTPSVYSPTHFSPGPRRPNDGSYSPRSRLNDPNTSTLDLDDEPRFSIAVSQADDEHDDKHSFEDDDEDGRRPSDEQDSRLSYLGPKMRFHSRAPWEMGDDIQEEEEALFDSPKQHAFPFSFGGGGGRASNSTGSSSPRPSLSRPSADSGRSHIMPKRSFDTINSQLSSRGAL